MKSFAVLAFAATALAQSSPPSGCQSSVSGTFNIQTVNVTSSRKRDIEARQLSGTLTLSLQNGNLKDQAGRTGYIAANYQFQFDAPVQAGARETNGFSLCSNGSLALGSSAIFYQCLSGDFYNLYSQSTGTQCSPIYITAVNQGSGSGASQISDGQPQATSARPAVSQISDGQPQASSAIPSVVSQISDGQPQAPSARTSAPVISQISDGQPQAPSAAPKPTGPLVSQISDGQPQAPSAQTSAPVISQISDGQPQAPVTTGPVVSQISDGQPQAPVTTGPVVSQISDGQPQAPVTTSIRGNATVNATRSAPAQYTGAAATGNAAAGVLAAGLFGLFALL